MQALNQLDITCFYFVNHGLVNPVFDMVMPFITNLDNWKIPILIIWLFLLFKGGKQGRVSAVLLIPVLILTDQTSSSLLKPLVGRIRPCYGLEDVRLLVGCGGKLAFPSSHATNIAGVAFLFSFFYRRGTIAFILAAVTVGFSRIYVGVHYPLDVFSGFALGSAAGAVVIVLYLKIADRYPALNYTGSRSKDP